jgi:hypothetical protein
MRKIIALEHITLDGVIQGQVTNELEMSKQAMSGNKHK